MPSRAARLAPAAASLAAAVLAGGCGAEQLQVSPLCFEARALDRALAAAPRSVALPDGTTVSECVSGASSAAELQDFGLIATRLAERLERRAARDPEAAVQLGFLVGAARVGAEQTNGVNLELIRRLERSAALEGAPPAAQRALVRGLRAGRELG